MRALRWLGLSCFAVALLAPSFALADPAEKAAAETLFQTGRDLVAHGDVTAACDKFEASQRLDPALGTMLHLADCYEREGRTASAWAMFGEAASLAEVSGQSGREKIARTRIASLEPKLVRVELHVPSEAIVPGLAIRIDGIEVPAASWGVALPVDPGTPTVQVTAPGRTAWSATARLNDHDAKVAVIDVPPLLLTEPVEPTKVPPPAPIPTVGPAPTPAKPPPIMEATDRGATQRYAGITVGAVGLAGLAAGAVLGGQAILKNDQSAHECRPEAPNLCTTRGAELRNEAKDMALGSTIGFIAGGTLAVTGLVVALTAPRAEAKKAVSAVRPVVGKNGGGLFLGGEW